jgi:hypothetical protein
VRYTLGRLAAYEGEGDGSTRVATPQNPESYEDYCRLLHGAAAELAAEQGVTSHIDGEKLEWLLFGPSDGEYPTFPASLPTVGRP